MKQPLSLSSQPNFALPSSRRAKALQRGTTLVFGSLLMLSACSSSKDPASDSNLADPAQAGANAAGMSNAASVTAGAGGAPITAASGAAGMITMLAGAGGASASNVSGAAGSEAMNPAAAGSAGAAGAGGELDPFAPEPSAGCSTPTTQALGEWVEFTIDTPDTPLGAYTREYIVRLPANYDPDHTYRLIYQAPGCGGDPRGPYSLEDFHADTAIQVGLAPEPDVRGPGNQCFTDFDIPESIEPMFFEALHEHLRQTYCFDQKRVFMIGMSSGSWLTNMMGCRYAGDILRAQGSVASGLRDGQTCNDKPIAGMWIYDADDTDLKVIEGVTRALDVNGCEGGIDGAREPYVVPGAPEQICERFSACPAEYPVVLCVSQGLGHDPEVDLANPGFWQFFEAL